MLIVNCRDLKSFVQFLSCMLLHLNQIFYFHLCFFFRSSPTFPSLKPKFPYPTFPTCPNYSLLISYAQTIPWQPITPLACLFTNLAVSHLHAKKWVPSRPLTWWLLHRHHTATATLPPPTNLPSSFNIARTHTQGRSGSLAFKRQRNVMKKEEGVPCESPGEIFE